MIGNDPPLGETISKALSPSAYTIAPTRVFQNMLLATDTVRNVLRGICIMPAAVSIKEAMLGIQ